MEIQIIKNKNIKEFENWSVWSCDVSKFDWEYADEEHCFIIEGKVTVFVGDRLYNICKGDYVIFSKGLKCVWDIHDAVRKFYSFK